MKKHDEKLTFEAKTAEEFLGVFKKEVKKVEDTLERIDEVYHHHLGWYDRFSDAVASVGGSWGFIFVFILFVMGWIILNLYYFLSPFDSYPFPLLNFILAIIAGIQAPIILMAELRSANRDRIRMEMDLRKDARDLHIDQRSLEILLEMQHDVKELKHKFKEIEVGHKKG